MALNQRQYEAIQLMVYTDLSRAEIARELKASKDTIAKWARQEEFQKELQKETSKKLGNLANKAVRRLEQLIDSRNDGVALGACKTVLEKTYWKENKVDNVININVGIDE